MNDQQPLALQAYELLAEAYAARIDTKPHNAYYERPATLSLLPDVEGLRVLDAGCGPGVYSEWLLAHGAEVVACDASPKMVELASKRLGNRCKIQQADLGKPLDWLQDESFDLVLSPLVLEYIEDWQVPFGEFARILKPGGMFIFSVTHPFHDYLYHNSDAYFDVEHVGADWKGFTPTKVYVPTFRRPLGATLGPLFETGFIIENILEPQPTAEFKTADPEHYAELCNFPIFLCIRARKQLNSE